MTVKAKRAQYTLDSNWKQCMKAELVTDALRMAWFRRRLEAGVIVHSDRGSQYCSGLFQDTLKAYGMRSSMSRRGDCWEAP